MTLQTRTATADLQRHAYNAAFYELGLGWHWDSHTFDGLLPVTCTSERVRKYMTAHQSHLLHAYDAEFLATAIEATKSRCLDQMMVSSDGSAMRSHTDWAALHSRQIGA
jgi:hypothetical protein